MSEVSVTLVPSGAHTTSSLTVRIANSDTGTSSTPGLKVGSVASGGGTGHRYVTLVFGQLPTKEDIYGVGVTDSSLAVTNLKFIFNVTTADTDTEHYHIKAIVDGGTTNFPAEVQGNATYNGPERDSSNSGSTREWYTGTAATYGNIVASGVISGEDIDYFRPDATGDVTLDMKDYVKSASLTWGDKFCFVIQKKSQADENKFIAASGASAKTTNTYMDAVLFYDDPEPSMPIIKLEADTDYRSSIVTMTTKPSEKDIISYTTRWKDGGYDAVDNRVGVYYNTSGSEEVAHTGGNPFATGIFKEVDGDIAEGFLDTEGETDYLVVWASDMSATGVDGLAVNRTMSNAVSHSRLSCTGSLSAGTAIGEELTLTVSGFSDAANSSAASFVKFGVNWDGETTASNDSINDYNIVTLDAAATTATIKHTFHKVGTYKVNVCVIDSKGFRSDFTQAESRAIAASNPVAVLRASRDTAVRARYGDEFSVITLSAAHSYPVGSDKMIFAHKFQHNSSTPVTTYPMDNDNSNFNDVTTTVKLKCNTASCDGTVLKVYGKVSVSSDGTPNVDNDANFDHYEYQVHDVSPHTTEETFGTVAQTGGEDVLFKSVDFVVVSTLDGSDVIAGGAVYTLADADGNVINNKIRAAKNTDKWGGYVLTSAMTVAFHTGNKTITRSSGDFLADGFVPGDTIWVDGAIEDVANNDLFTIASVTATVITVNESTLVTGDGSDAGVYMYKINGPTLPIASYAENTPTITCAVRQKIAAQAAAHAFQDSANVTQALRFESEEHDTLDLDTQADAGHIAIQDANLTRSGGISSLMPLGGKSYPIGTTRTRMGSPSVSLSVRALTQTGYRLLWNLIEGGRYEWVTIDSKKVDVPGTAYKQLRMRLNTGSLKKDPSLASQYTASLSFIVIGELVT